MRRFGMITGLKGKKSVKIENLHSTAQPDVLKMISECHIQNDSSYLRQSSTK